MSRFDASCEEILREDLGSTSRSTSIWKCWDAPPAELVACCVVLCFFCFFLFLFTTDMSCVTSTDADSRCWAAGPDVAYPSRLAQQLSTDQNIAGIKVLWPHYRKLSERLLVIHSLIQLVKYYTSKNLFFVVFISHSLSVFMEELQQVTYSSWVKFWWWVEPMYIQDLRFFTSWIEMVSFVTD